MGLIISGLKFLLDPLCRTFHEPIDQRTSKETHADDHPCPSDSPMILNVLRFMI